ncbi:DUF4118 domain-containing protein [Streptomyces sp. NPDC056194]|uniref:DUF4118 domain-containing protein n=1 Tax=unclassified Streptomyces TaxID=2593676 RepID=UPI0035DBE7BE
MRPRGRSAETAGLTSEALLFLLTVVGVARIGGVASALTASLLLDHRCIPPVGRFGFQDPDSVLALVVFAVVAGSSPRPPTGPCGSPAGPRVRPPRPGPCPPS